MPQIGQDVSPLMILLVLPRISDGPLWLRACLLKFWHVRARLSRGKQNEEPSYGNLNKARDGLQICSDRLATERAVFSSFVVLGRALRAGFRLRVNVDISFFTHIFSCTFNL